MHTSKHFPLFFFPFLLCLSKATVSYVNNDGVKKNQADKLSLAVIVDYTSRAGKEGKIAMNMAIQDFFGSHSQSPINLFFRDSRGDPVRSSSIATTLIRRQHVQAIIGLGTLQEAVFIADLGNKSGIPVISLANEVPFGTSWRWPFLVSAARSQAAEMNTVAAIIQSWQWRRVNIIYEDINSAINGIVPYLINALQDMNLQISELLPISPSVLHNSLSKELKRLKNGQCRVFIVHTSIKTATAIFREAKILGMMEKEFVWITTTSTTNLIDTLNASLISSMKGLLGVKSYFSHSSALFEDFHSRFQKTFHLQYPDEPYPEPGIHALQAYDAMWAVALAIEGFSNWKTSPKHSILTRQRLLNNILNSNFEGLTGQIYFKDGMLEPAHIFSIVNVFGKSYRQMGYWTEQLGFSETVGLDSNCSQSMSVLGQVFWPGGSWSKPRGWALPPSERPLRIGVPMGNTHKEFVDAKRDGPGGNLQVTGFTIDVFNATINILPYHLPYNFTPFEGKYDTLVQQVDLQNFDAVVGDTAIVANRYAYAEFSQPYTEPGLQMLVYVKPRRADRAWLFIKPFTTTLWMSIIAMNVYNGLVVWLIERNRNPEFSGSIRSQIGTMLSSAFITLFSPQVGGLHSNLSRMVMVPWLFVALIITQSFTASLTSLLTLHQLNEDPVDIETLKKNGAKVGCDVNSFVVEYLEVALGFEHDNIVQVSSEEQYRQDLVSGNLSAAFLEIPHIKLFQAKNCMGFTTSGPIYNVGGGFGFVFPRNSPYLPDISQAVLELTETGELKKIEDALISSYSCTASKSNDKHASLGLTSFKGLLMITVGTSTIALTFFFVPNCTNQIQSICWCLNQRQQTQQQQQQELELQQLQLHDPRADEHWLFAPEMENQAHWQ